MALFGSGCHVDQSRLDSLFTFVESATVSLPIVFAVSLMICNDLLLIESASAAVSILTLMMLSGSAGNVFADSCSTADTVRQADIITTTIRGLHICDI